MSKKTTPKDPLSGRPLSALSRAELANLLSVINCAILTKQAEEDRQ
jgi:hypothetical protein